MTFALRPNGRNLVELLRSFRVTLVVFVAVVIVAYTQRDAIATWLASMDAHQDASHAASLPAAFKLVIALRLGIFVALVPLAAEAWIVVCRLRNAAVQVRLWPAFCIATLLACAGSLALTWHCADALRQSLVYLT
jgi:hypothetical protein